MTFKKGYTPWNKGLTNHLSEESRKKMSDNSKGLPAWNKGKTGVYSEETLEAMGRANKGRSPAMKGKKHTEKSKKKMRESHIGQIAWNKGLTGCYSEETRLQMSKSAKGKPSHMKGKHHTDEAKRKNSEAHKGNIPWNKGKTNHLSNETLKQMSDSHKGQKCSDKNPMWQGGKSFEVYGKEFNNKLKEKIRDRDQHKCQICFKSECEDKTKLSVHHIDYNKKNNNINNLISLCKKCHCKANGKRDKWIALFELMVLYKSIRVTIRRGDTWLHNG